ncbi:MAG: DUF6544 family protein [Bacteroidales bacterium]
MKKLFIIIGFMGLISCSPKKQVEKLLDTSSTIDNKNFNYAQLENLPDPVRRYFQYAIPEGKPYISHLRLKHNGSFKTGVGKDWIDIKGEQYFSAQPPGFVWIGKTRQFKAIDSYIENTGNLSVYLFGLMRIVNSKGSSVDQAELLRWLGESVWMPTNLLPDKQKEWTAIDENSAKLTFTHNGQSVYYIVHFNKTGQITKMETKRYMEEGRLEKWEGRLSNYTEHEGIKVPQTIEATWLLSEGQHTYARFRVETFEYDKPYPFK